MAEAKQLCRQRILRARDVADLRSFTRDDDCVRVVGVVGFECECETLAWLELVEHEGAVPEAHTGDIEISDIA